MNTKHIVSGMKKNTAALLKLVQAAAAAQKQNDDENSRLPPIEKAVQNEAIVGAPNGVDVVI